MDTNLTSESLNRAGAAMFKDGDYGAAEDFFQKALDRDERNAEAWSNLGYTYQTTGHRDEAVRCYRRALDLEPGNPSVLTNIGMVTQLDGSREAAKAIFRRVLEQGPNPLAATNLGICELMDFNFAEGWRLWESHYEMERPRGYGLPLWDGKAKVRVLVCMEQGIGDIVLFSTLLPELVGRDIRFTCEMDERLVPAFERSFPENVFVLKPPKEGFQKDDGKLYADEAAKECQAYIPMGMLGRLYRQSMASFMGQPHRLLLAPKPPRCFSRPGKVIGISWRSYLPRKDVRLERMKSAALRYFAPMAALPDTALLNLQYGPVEREIAECGFQVSPAGIDLFWDLDGMLGRIEQCDVIVTTCCVTAHLAGALGKTCYVMYLNGNPPLFSWQANKQGRSIWYRSCQIVSKSTWEETITAVISRL